MSSVRAFVQEDIPQVVALTWRFLQAESGSPPPSMGSYFRELFFHSPFSDKALPSLVYQDGYGRVVGFLGILRRRMSLHGKLIEIALGTSLYAMHWSRPLRPVFYAVYAVSRFGRSLLFDVFVFGCKPVCKIVDVVAA